jgi:pyridoxamine 5'-phosphate oxidase-like protein
VRWEEVERRQPRLAELGREKLGGPGVVLVGTVRRDGSPRVSPVEPFFWEGDFWLPMGLGSTKAKDLMRDPRVVVHSIVTSKEGADGEYKARGRARLEIGTVLNERIAEAISQQLGWSPVAGKFHLFRVALEDITFIRWGDHNDQYVTRWPEGVEYVRRGTSATSVGPREPITDLLIGEG